MTDENIVNRAKFQDNLKILYSEHSDSNRSLWNKKQEFIVIKFLQEVKECSIQKKIPTIITQKRMNWQKSGTRQYYTTNCQLGELDLGGTTLERPVS